MARRRINTRFLTIFLCVIVGIWIAVYAAQVLLIHESPGPYIDAGKEAMRQQQWDQASALFGHATQLDPHNIDVCMLLGSALHNLGQSNSDAILQERSAYEHALEIDPNYLPAIKALIHWYQQNVNPPAAWAFAKLDEYARRAHELDPSDQAMAAMPAELVVQEWIARLVSDPQAVDQALSDLQGFLQKNPADQDAAYNIAKANLNQALELTAESPVQAQPPEATALYDQAVQVFDKLVKGDGYASQDSNASMHQRFAMILENLADYDHSLPSRVDMYHARAKAEIQRAMALVRPKDPEYLLIVNTAIDVCEQQRDFEGAIRICRSLPPIPQAQIRLAQLLARSDKTRPEAEQILDSMAAQLQDDPNRLSGLRMMIVMQQTDFEIIDYVRMVRADQRSALMDRIQSQLTQLLGASPAEVQTPDGSFRSGVPIEIRREQARVMLLQGQYLPLVQTFNPLIANDPAIAGDTVVLTCMADAYAGLNQIGRAIDVMQSIVNAQGGNRDIDSRKFLVKLLVENAPEKAGGPLEDLMHDDPSDPDLIPIRINYLMATDPDHNLAEIKRLYPHLREDSPDLIIAKAKIAATLRNFDDAVRLMNLGIADNPKEASSYANLAFTYLYMGKKDEALEAINRGVAELPDDPDLKLLIPEIKGEDPKVVEHLREQLAQANHDPLQRELELATIAHDQGDIKSQERHLKAAEAASPDSPRVWNELFTFYLNTGRPDDAAPYVPKLAAVDYDQAGGAMCQYLLARARGDYMQARDIARQLTQDKPEFAISWVALGQVTQIQGSYDDAMVDFTTALDRQPNNLDAYRGLITCCYELQRPDDARSYIVQGLKQLPGNAMLRGMLVDNVLTYGNPPDAIAVLQEEIKRTPDNPQLYAALGSVYVRVARIAEIHQQHDQATQLLQDAVNMLEDAVTKWPDEPEMYVVLTDAALAAGQPADAEKILRSWAIRPAWRLRPEPHVRLADLYERTGHPDYAESELRTALVRSDYSVDLEVEMAGLMVAHKKFDDALALLRAANPDQPAVRQKVIEVMLAAGRPADAEAQIQSDLQGNPPDRARLLGMWAQLALMQGNFAAAVDRGNQSLALDANNLDVVYTRARARLRISPPDNSGAIDDLKQIQEIQPGNVAIRRDLITAYLQANMFDDASIELEAEVRADPANKAARMELIKLYCDAAHPRLTQALHLLQEIDNTPPYNTDPDIFQGEAVLLADLHDLSNAMDKSDKALSLSPHDSAIWRSHLSLLLESQRYQDAITAINGMDPKMLSNWWVLLDRSEAEVQTGDNASAAADVQAALAAADAAADSEAINSIAQVLAVRIGLSNAIDTIAPFAKKRVATKLPLAMMYIRNHDENDALATIESVMTGFDQLQRGDQIAALGAAGIIYSQCTSQSLTDRAYDAYQRCLKLDPNRIDVLNNLACLLADDYSPPRVDEGMTYAQRAMDLVTDSGRPNPTVMDTQGWLLILSGSAAQGVDLINKALDIQPFPDAYLHLGEGYLALQYPDEADKQAQLGLDLIEKQDPKDQDVKVKAKLQNLIVRSEEQMKSKQQAQVP